MTRSGDVDISALGGFASYPSLGGNLLYRTACTCWSPLTTRPWWIIPWRIWRPACAEVGPGGRSPSGQGAYCGMLGQAPDAASARDFLLELLEG